MELWPRTFYVQIINQRPLLREVHSWVKAHTPAMCMFMPDRLPDTNTNNANQSNFENFAQVLMHNQWVSCISGDPPSLRPSLTTAKLGRQFRLPLRHGTCRTEFSVQASSSFLRVLRGIYSSAPSFCKLISPISY